MTNEDEGCRPCRMSIPKDASICFHCQRSQGYFSAKLQSGAGFISVVSVILSIALVTLSWLQFLEATKQRNSADQAVAEAKVAMGEAKRARDETRNTVEDLRTNIKLVLEMEYLTSKLVVAEHDPARAGRVQQKLEEFAVPNEKERKKWLESLK